MQKRLIVLVPGLHKSQTLKDLDKTSRTSSSTNAVTALALVFSAVYIAQMNTVDFKGLIL